jgi:hypothetical protein
LKLENTLQILHTIGICVSAIALIVIAFFAFTLWIPFYPSQSWDDESESLQDEGKDELRLLPKRKRRQHKR